MRIIRWVHQPLVRGLQNQILKTIHLSLPSHGLFLAGDGLDFSLIRSADEHITNIFFSRFPHPWALIPQRIDQVPVCR